MLSHIQSAIAFDRLSKRYNAFMSIVYKFSQICHSKFIYMENAFHLRSSLRLGFVWEVLAKMLGTDLLHMILVLELKCIKELYSTKISRKL